MPKKEGKKFAAFITAFLSIIGFIIALLAWKKDEYIMHYAKQSLVVFIVAIIASALQAIAILPVIGDIIAVALNILVLML